ncbi:MAG TPA: hypothetical protein VIL36_18995 [Acidimicrobiales bacterium]
MAKAGRYLFAWVLGVAAVVAPWVAIDQVPIDVNDWASIYVAGAVGGLALELMLGRGRLELPGPSAPEPDEGTDDGRRPFGPLMDLGFLARVASSGIAAVALLLVYYALVGEAETAAELDELASDPSTFGWAVFLGASSPAIWTLAQRLVSARIAAAEAIHTAKLESLHAAQMADENSVLSSVNSSLQSTITAAAAELRAAQDMGLVPTPGAQGAAGAGAAEAGAGAGPVADALAVAPVVDAGVVIGDIEEVVRAAAEAPPGEVDVEALSLELFEKLPAPVAGLTGPPVAGPEAPLAPGGTEGAADAGSDVAVVTPEGDVVVVEGMSPPGGSEGAPVTPAATPIDRALQILEEGVASA